MKLLGKMRWLLFSAIGLLLLGGTSFAQNIAVFEKVNSGQGIHQSIIYGLAQDTLGNIWACTEEGIIRYNSQEAFLYNKYRGLPENFGNRINTIYIDAQHKIWIGAEGGIALYNAQKDTFDWLKPTDGLTPNLVKEITADAEGNIWIGCFNGVWKYRPGTEHPSDQFQQVSNIPGTESLYFEGTNLLVGSSKGLYSIDINHLPVETITTLSTKDLKTTAIVTCIQKYGQHFLLGTKSNGLFLADSTFLSLQHIKLPIFETQYFPITKILSNAEGNIYLATDGVGLIYLNSKYEFLTAYTNDVNNPNSISSNGIYDLLLDQESILWVATYGGGINFLNPAKNNFQNIVHQINTSNSIAHNFTRSILEDTKGNIWFGTKQGISIWLKESGNWRHLSNFTSKGKPTSSVIIMALEEDGEYIWAGTYGNGAFRINKADYSYAHYGSNEQPNRKLKLDKVYTILKDIEGNIWFGGIDEKLQQISPSGAIQSLPYLNLKDIIASRDGSILIAGRNGVQRISKNKVTDIKKLRPGTEGREFTTINCLHEDVEGNLIIGTNGAGLIFYNLQTEKATGLDVNDGLPSDIVQGILPMDKENIWVSTTRGLARINMMPGDTTVKVFDKSDGLASMEFNYGSYTRLSDGRLLFGGVDGLTMFDPKEISYQMITPKIVFEEFRLFNKTVEPGASSLSEHINVVKNIKLKASENAFTLKFLGILHSTPSKIKYSWQLEGFNDEWSEANSENQTNFTNLPPGAYTFRVKAANRDGHWGPERQLSINILPPWWATTTAYFIYLLLGILVLVGLVYITGLYINKRNAEQQIAFFSNITHELKTPLTILLSSLEKLPNDQNTQPDTEQKVKGTIKRLNSLFDQLLNFHKVTVGGRHNGAISKINLPGHIEKLVNSFMPLLEDRSISIEIIGRYEKQVFYYTQEVFDKILFNLVSNAIKYSKQNGKITIKLSSVQGGNLRLSFSDDGIGIPKDQQKFILKRYYRGRNAINSQMPGTGLGLMMVKNLVEQDRGSISFSSIENVGTTFTVLLKTQESRYHKSAMLPQNKPVPKDLYENTQIEEFSDAKILLVEDNDELRQVLLDKIGVYFQVFEARNGKEGLEMVKQVFPDLILTDLIMPEMDGMTMCQELQKDINLNHIPIFMLTVLNNSVQKMESIENGITEYMEKPIDFNLLLAKMTNTLAWQEKLRKKYLHQVEIENAEKYRNKRDADFINGLEKFVLSQLSNESFSIHDLCKQVGMSRTALYMKLKNLVDLSPQDFIIHARLRYARKLLIEQDSPIKEVAYKSGFSNPKYFSTSFKKIFGISPSDFLKNLEAKNE
ncbi:MAG: hybrid sensor histidine kinase/response regulator [Saprospiraceae bacterium]|nr:MAG: hybrid sensor histidine kinase/response regulator [Saprospiraceae bacterium]